MVLLGCVSLLARRRTVCGARASAAVRHSQLTTESNSNTRRRQRRGQAERDVSAERRTRESRKAARVEVAGTRSSGVVQSGRRKSRMVLCCNERGHANFAEQRCATRGYKALCVPVEGNWCEGQRR